MCAPQNIEHSNENIIENKTRIILYEIRHKGAYIRLTNVCNAFDISEFIVFRFALHTDYRVFDMNAKQQFAMSCGTSPASPNADAGGGAGAAATLPFD